MKWASMLVVLGLVGCGAVPAIEDEGDPAPAQEAPHLETQIDAGIYTGRVTCDYRSRNTAQGLVESYSYDFNQTYVFTESGLPATGVNVNPDNDQLEFFGTVFDVTNRTFAATDSGYVENASMVGTVDGDRVNGLWTWTFTDAGSDSILYQLNIVWTYRSAGIPWTIDENCSGTLLAR